MFVQDTRDWPVCACPACPCPTTPGCQRNGSGMLAAAGQCSCTPGPCQTCCWTCSRSSPPSGGRRWGVGSPPPSPTRTWVQTSRGWGDTGTAAGFQCCRLWSREFVVHPGDGWSGSESRWIIDQYWAHQGNASHHLVDEDIRKTTQPSDSGQEGLVSSDIDHAVSDENWRSQHPILHPLST